MVKLVTQNGESFDAKKLASSAAPAGFYNATLLKISENTSAAGNQYLRAEFQLDGPTNAGMIVSTNFNHGHDKPNVVEMAYRMIAQMALGLGVEAFEDTSELHGRSCVLRIFNEPDDNGNPRNEIGSYFTQEKFDELKAADKLPSLSKAKKATAGATPANVPNFGAAVAPSAPATPLANEQTPPWMA